MTTAAEMVTATAAATAAGMVTAATAAAAGSAVQLAVDSAGASDRSVLGQWEEAARLLGLRWTTYGAQLP